MIFSIAENYKSENFNLRFFKRFLDDLFLVIKGSTKLLHDFVEEINQIHPSINFTMSHTKVYSEYDQCSCPKKSDISFLDTLLSLKEDKIIVDLYRKPTDRNLYLLPTSCHPPQMITNIPYSLALRIVRICSESDTRDKRLNELRDLLSERNYNLSIINSAILRAKKISRTQALCNVAPSKSNVRPVYVITYDPRLPNIQSIVNKHWRSMKTVDPYLATVFPEPPLTAFKRQRNIKDFIIRSKVSESRKFPKRIKLGMKKCEKSCLACPFILEQKTVKNESKIWYIRSNVNCKTTNFIYMIECNIENCKQRYIGESGRSLKERLSNHIQYVKSNTQATGEHFNSKGHNLANMKIIILEKVKKESEFYRKEREKYLIRKFNTYYKGMNKTP